MLIIEDDESVIEPLECFIADEMKEFTLLKASSGADGVALVETEKPDLLILDMKLDPFMDGLEVLRRIRSHIDRMAVIVLTGFVDPKMETEARKMGVDIYMEKPIYWPKSIYK